MATNYQHRYAPQGVFSSGLAEVRAHSIVFPCGRHSVIRKLFSAGVQMISSQVLGVLFFYILSVRMSKAEFGLISWSSATVMTLTAVLGFGLELIVTRRLAAARTTWPASAFQLHALVTTLLFAGCALLVRFLVQPGQESQLFWLPLFFVAQGLVFVGTPLKAALNARERFTPYAVISFVSNAAKVMFALVWGALAPLDVWAALYILAACSAFELFALIAVTLRYQPISIRFRWPAYWGLVREARPQFLTVLFDTSLSRFSWILLGLLLSDTAIVADYSFAYRAYEMAKMPVLIVGLLLLPRLSRTVTRDAAEVSKRIETLGLFLNFEMLFAFGMILIGNILWSPIVDYLTGGRYGTVNEWNFLLLSLCIPSQFAINLMWSSLFAEKHYGQLSLITMITGVINLTASLVLIPLLHGEGAALAFLVATIIQTGLYFREMKRAGYPLSARPMFLFLLLAVASGLVSKLLPLSAIFQLLAGLTVFTFAAWSVGLLHKERLRELHGYLQR